jgi:hypothetical protein
VIGSKCHGPRASYFQTIPTLVKTSQAVVDFWKWEYMTLSFLSLGIPSQKYEKKHIYMIFVLRLCFGLISWVVGDFSALSKNIKTDISK